MHANSSSQLYISSLQKMANYVLRHSKSDLIMVKAQKFMSESQDAVHFSGIDEKPRLIAAAVINQALK